MRKSIFIQFIANTPRAVKYPDFLLPESTVLETQLWIQNHKRFPEYLFIVFVNCVASNKAVTLPVDYQAMPCMRVMLFNSIYEPDCTIKAGEPTIIYLLVEKNCNFI